MSKRTFKKNGNASILNKLILKRKIQFLLFRWKKYAKTIFNLIFLIFIFISLSTILLYRDYVKDFFVKKPIDLISQQNIEFRIENNKFYYSEPMISLLKSFGVDKNINLKLIYFIIKQYYQGLENLSITYHAPNIVVIHIEESKPIFFYNHNNGNLKGVTENGLIFDVKDDYLRVNIPMVHKISSDVDHNINQKSLDIIKSLLLAIDNKPLIKNYLISINNFHDLFWIINLKGGINLYINFDEAKFDQMFSQVVYGLNKICNISTENYLNSSDFENDIKKCGLIEIDFRIRDKIFLNFNHKFKI